MKKLIVLLLTSTLLSCSSDDNNPSSETIDSPVIGKWMFVQELTNGEDSTFECSKMDVQEFKEDGTYVANIHGGSSSTVNGETIFECIDGSTTATFKISGDTINFVFEPGTPDEEPESKKFEINSDDQLVLINTTSGGSEIRTIYSRSTK